MNELMSRLSQGEKDRTRNSPVPGRSTAPPAEEEASEVVEVAEGEDGAATEG